MQGRSHAKSRKLGNSWPIFFLFNSCGVPVGYSRSDRDVGGIGTELSSLFWVIPRAEAGGGRIFPNGGRPHSDCAILRSTLLWVFGDWHGITVCYSPLLLQILYFLCMIKIIL